MQGDVVVLQGEVGSEMYFITEGTLDVRVYNNITPAGVLALPRPPTESDTLHTCPGRNEIALSCSIRQQFAACVMAAA